MTRHWKLIFVLSLILLGKLSGFLKDVFMTFYHGVSVVTDAYFLSNSISSLLYMAIYSAIPVLLVPIYSHLLVVGNRSRINQELSAALFFFLFISVCVAIFTFSSAGWLVEVFSNSIEGQVKELAVNYLSIMAVTFAFSTLVSFLNSIQTVDKTVIPSYIAPVVSNFVFCVGLYFFSSGEGFYKVLMLGVLAWSVLLVVNYCLSRQTFSFRPGAALSLFSDKNFILLFLPAVVAFYIEQVNGFVGVYFSSELGVGAISVFSYANKLNMIFLSVFLVFLTASLFPRIAAVSARNDQIELFRYLMTCIRLLVICSVPAVVYMSFYSEEIVRLLFQRGNFMGDDVVKVASVFSVVLLALPFCLVRDVMNRVFFSHGNTLTPVLLSLGALAMNLVLSYTLYQQYGLVGLAVSAVISTLFNSLVVLFLVQHKIKLDLLAPCLKILALCSVCGVIGYFSLEWLNGLFPNYWLVLSVPFFVVYFILLLLLRVREARFVVDFVFR